MRRSITILLAGAMLLTVSACSGSAGTDGSPAPADRPVASAAASPSAAGTPALSWRDVTEADLEDALADPEAFLTGTGPRIIRLGSAEELGLDLYGLSGHYGGGVLLVPAAGEPQWSDQTFLPEEAPILPILWQGDYDGDGDDELAVDYLTVNSAAEHIFELHLYDRTEGHWTDAALRAADWEGALLEQIGYTFDAHTGQVDLTVDGSDSTCWLEEQPDPDPERPLTLQGETYFREEDGRITAIFGVGLRLTGVEEPWQFARLLADVDWNGEALSVGHLRLETNYGA